MAESAADKLSQALWRLYQRPERVEAWSGADAGNLPWNDPDFSRRMLREHLDQSHGAASRTAAERQLQIDWLWEKLELQAGARLLDFTCGPGLYAMELAKRGCFVTGVDFAPASIEYAGNLAAEQGVADRCDFALADVREWDGDVGDAADAADAGDAGDAGSYDAILFIYGQMAVFPPGEAQKLLNKLGRLLKPGGWLCLELLDPAQIDKKKSSWWYTGNSGLWGDAPFLHLGERVWDEATACSTERFYVLHLGSGEIDMVTLNDQSYQPEQIEQMLAYAGLALAQKVAGWGGLPLYDAEEWIVYLGRK